MFSPQSFSSQEANQFIELLLLLLFSADEAESTKSIISCTQGDIVTGGQEE